MKPKKPFYIEVFFYSLVAFLVICWSSRSFGYEWIKTFGIGGNSGNSVQQTTDGGYIILATLGFQDGSKLIKTDAEGNQIWSKIFVCDPGRSVQETTDGGYIITGWWGSDVYLIKTDADGNEVWSKTFGGSNADLAFSVQQTTDGGYIIVGRTWSFGAGNADVYLIKTDADGNEVWSKTFGGSNADLGYLARQTFDGGYIIAGFTGSFGAGDYDVYLIKTDADGNEVWSKTFGGSEDDLGTSVQQTVDGGYIIAGYTELFGGHNYNVYLIKTDADGNQVWSKTFEKAVWGKNYWVQQTTDSGYIIVGTTMVHDPWDFAAYLIKTDADGNEVWSKTFEGSPDAEGSSVQQTTDGGYIITGCIGDYWTLNGYNIYLIYYKPDENQTPVAVCDDVIVLTDPGLCSADASVDDGSFDPDGDEITLEQTPPGPYDLGDTDVTLTVTDDNGATDTCDAIVTVEDQEAPVITSVTANPNNLWPPNHKMVPVVLAVDATDNCDSVCQIISVASNEPVNGLGDGNTAPDWVITGDLTVKLRAERSGTGSGRIYAITVECADSSGNSSTDTTTVTVPHDKVNKNNKK